jgi:UDP-N-acetylglucosamine/UDP-N-acetylgalactosamine diphosphorylase
MSEKVKQAMEYCAKYGQEHLIPYMRPCYSEESLKFATQILQHDLRLIRDRYTVLRDQEENLCMPPEIFDLLYADTETKQGLFQSGLSAIKSGKVAAVTMAGGQGTRLGHFGPKGTYELPFDPIQSFFEIQSQSLIELRDQAHMEIPWLIMTSQENYADTKEYFEQKRYFGYGRDKIRFFTQSMIPVVDMDGKILVHHREILLSPNGNGGIFSSLHTSGNLQWLKENQIRHLFICGIDNVLVKMADPLFIGFAIQNQCDIAAKSSLKKGPKEQAGVFCLRNNRIAYLEYTEINERIADATNERGEYLFGDIGIGMYVYHIDLIEQLSECPLPFHEARKCVEYSLPTGETIRPEKPNAIKFETFIFDSFSHARKVSVLRVPRNREFAPVKNMRGDDSPEDAAILYSKRKDPLL